MGSGPKALDIAIYDIAVSACARWRGGYDGQKKYCALHNCLARLSSFTRNALTNFGRCRPDAMMLRNYIIEERFKMTVRAIILSLSLSLI